LRRKFRHYPDDRHVSHIRDCKRGQQFSTPTQPAGARGAQGSPKMPLNHGLQPRPAARKIREYPYSRLPETALLSAGNCLRSIVEARNPKASNRRKHKALKPPPIGGFSEFSPRALFSWHRLLFKDRGGLKDIGHYRTGHEAMKVVSGALHAPTVHFETPPSSRVPKEMARFVTWFNRTAPAGSEPLAALTRAGIAPLYFESIHPFEDGNGTGLRRSRRLHRGLRHRHRRHGKRHRDR
jgi:hypothetical protein